MAKKVPKRPPRDARVALRMTHTMLEVLQKQAVDKDISLSSLIVELLKKQLKSEASAGENKGISS